MLTIKQNGKLSRAVYLSFDADNGNGMTHFWWFQWVYQEGHKGYYVIHLQNLSEN